MAVVGSQDDQSGVGNEESRDSGHEVPTAAIRRASLEVLVVAHDDLEPQKEPNLQPFKC